MKHFYYMLLLVLASMQAAQDQPLSSTEAINIIWKMNYKDISELYEAVFSELQGNKEGVINKVTTTIKKMRKFIAQNIWGESLVDNVLQTFLSAKPEEQELMKREIKASRNEYNLPKLNIFMCIMSWPIGWVMLISEQREHIKTIETKRAQFATVN